LNYIYLIYHIIYHLNKNINSDLNTYWESLEKIYNDENDTIPKYQELIFTFELKVSINKYLIYGIFNNNDDINKNIKSCKLFGSNDNNVYSVIENSVKNNITKSEWLLNNFIIVSCINNNKYKYYLKNTKVNAMH
jgi:hypothetical protein